MWVWDVDRATSVQRGDDHLENTLYRYIYSFTGRQATATCTKMLTEKSTEKSTCQVLLTCRQADWDAAYCDTHHNVYQEVDQDSTQGTDQERNNVLEAIVTGSDFEWWFQRNAASRSLSHQPNSTCCTSYSTEHLEALHRAQTVVVRLNLLSITIIIEAYM